MSRQPRPLIYKIGRVTVLFAILAAGGTAQAQDAPPPPVPSEAPIPPSPEAVAPVTPLPSADVSALQTRLDALEQRTRTLEEERAKLLAQPAPAPRVGGAFTADDSGF